MANKPVPSAQIIPFPRRPLGLTPHERARITAWCDPQGPAWETRWHRTQDHGAYAAIVSPRSIRYRSGHADPSWIMLREEQRVIVFDPASQNDLGCFETVEEALGAISLAEGLYAAAG
jgi:hypothetical protein